MSLEETLFDTEAAMEKAVDYLVHELASVRTGKASPSLVEGLEVDAYGSRMRLKQLAVISTPEPRLIVIQPFDASTTKDIEKAIKESKLGINPLTDGKLIRLPIPELSEDRRKDLVRTVKQMGEEAKVRIRSVRRDGIDAAKKLKTSGDLTEDGLRDAEAEIQKLTDGSVESIEKHVSHKEAELMKV
jgi:ribosome recycling factor